jgi:hypothetical protein
MLLIQMNVFQESILSAISETEKYSKMETEKELSDLSHIACDIYDTYKLSLREYDILKIIGKSLSLKNSINVLDVGCGPASTAKILLSEIVNKVNYKALGMPNLQNDYIIQSHLQQDIFDDSCVPDNFFYDIVIIDIEPHGCEIEVYEKIKKYMNPTHLCILKHIAYMDLYGDSLAKKFIKQYHTQVWSCFIKPFGNLFEDVRDTFVVILT